MKKLLSLFVIMAMVLSFTAAFAEADTEAAETTEAASTEISWADFETSAADQIAEGSFTSFDDAGFNVWIPNSLTAADLTDDEVAQGYLAYYENADAGYAVSVICTSANGMTLEDYKAALPENDASEIEEVTVNGLTAVTYELAETDAVCLSIVTDNGNIFEICGAPKSDEAFASTLALIMASIQAA